MTREEAILLSAYTGFLLAPDFSEVHKFCENTLGRPIWTHEFARPALQNEIQEKLRPQIMELVQSISALCPVRREQIKKMKKEPVEGEYDELYAPTYKCPECGFENIGKGNFCQNCGCLYTDEAVDMMMEKINNMEEMTNEH